MPDPDTADLLAKLDAAIVRARAARDANTGDRIRYARLRAGLTQTELADRLGVSQEAVSAWERGARRPTVVDVDRIADVCGVEIVTLDR